MALKAYEADTVMNEIAGAIMQAKKQLASALQSVTVAKNNLNGMTATYGPSITEVKDAAAADPTDPHLAGLAVRGDKYIYEFGKLKTYAVDLEAAATGVAKP